MQKTGIDVHLAQILLFLLPLVYVTGLSSYNTLRYLFFGIMSLVLVILALYRFLQYKWVLSSLVRSWYFYGLIGYLSSFLLASIFSVDRSISFWSTFERTDGWFVILFMSFFALSIYSIVSINGPKVVKQLFVPSIMGATVLSLVILLAQNGLYLLNWEWLLHTKQGAMLGNSSLAAAYILWNIFFALILFIKSDSFKQRALWAFTLLVLCGSPLFFNWQMLIGAEKYEGIISLIGSARGALAGIILGFLVSIGVYLSLHANKIRKYIGGFIIAVVFLATIWGGATLLQPTSSLHQKFIEYAGPNRFIFWDNAWSGFLEHPILGMGPNTFNFAFHKFFNPQMLLPGTGVEIFADEAHNIFFKTLLDGGILLILSLLFLIFSIASCLLKLRDNEHFSKIEIALLLGALFAWLWQDQFVFDSVASLAMLFLVCGISYGGLAKKIETKKSTRHYLTTKEKYIVFGAVCVVLVLFTYTIFLPYKKVKLINSTYETKLPMRASLWNNLEGISPMGDHIDSVLIFNNIFIAYNKEKEHLRTSDPNKKEIVLKELDAVIEYLSKLTSSSQKNNYDLILSTAKILYTRMYIANEAPNSSIDQLKDLLQRAITLSPSDPQPHWIKAELELSTNNPLGAKNTLEQAFLLAPYIDRTHTLLLKFAKMMHDDLYYNFVLKRARENSPGVFDK